MMKIVSPTHGEKFNILGLEIFSEDRNLELTLREAT
jgi:hypothetical protein